MDSHPVVKAAWRQQFNAKRRNHDMASEVLCFIFLIVPQMTGRTEMVTPSQARYVLFEYFVCVLYFILAMLHPPWYVSWRGSLLTCRQIVKLGCFYIFFAGSAVENHMQPLEIPADLLSRLKFLFMTPAILIQVRNP